MFVGLVTGMLDGPQAWEGKGRVLSARKLIGAVNVFLDVCDIQECTLSIFLVLQAWEGKGVVLSARKLIGATNPLTAEPGTIRGDFAVDVGRYVNLPFLSRFVFPLQPS